MNMFTLVAVLGVWLPFGAATVQGLFVAVVLMGVGTGSFTPLGGEFFFWYSLHKCLSGVVWWHYIVWRGVSVSLVDIGEKEGYEETNGKEERVYVLTE